MDEAQQIYHECCTHDELIRATRRGSAHWLVILHRWVKTVTRYTQYRRQIPKNLAFVSDIALVYGGQQCLCVFTAPACT